MEGPSLMGLMVRNDFMVLTILCCCDANMGALLSRITVTKLTESFDQI